MTLPEAKAELEKFVKLKTTLQPAFVDVLLNADLVEEVHCADCRFLTFSDMYGECGKGIMGVVNPNDYCSRGERRDG